MPITFSQSGLASLLPGLPTQTIAANASVWARSTGPIGTSLSTGSAQLTMTGNVSGYAIYRYNPDGQEAVVPLETRNARAYVLAFDNTDGITTGVAISGVSGQAINIPVALRNDTGASIGTSTISLASNGHNSFLLANQFPQTANIRGTIEFDAPTGAQISVLGIRSPPALTFTSLPALAK